jgi:MOSC domain-containing protein YiiM
MTDSPTFTGSIVSLNRSAGGVPKFPVPRARVTRDGMEGDRQRNRRHHGGPERALCLLGEEVIASLRAEGHPIDVGTTGENVTVRGIPWERVVPGARLALGEVIVEVTDYAHPCRNIRGSFEDERFARVSPKVHPEASRVYARVLREGELAVGDEVRLEG